MVTWLVKKVAHNPEGLLALLIRAQKIEDNQSRASLIFRAGLRVGMLHPEIAREVLESPEPEYNI